MTAPSSPLPRVALISSLRDAAHLLPHWRAAVEAWTLRPAVTVLVENDSADDTKPLLLSWLDDWSGLTVASFTTGHPRMPRAASMELFAYMGRCWAHAIDVALQIPDWDFAYLAGASKWTGPTVVERLVAHELDVVGAMVMFHGIHYETWCAKTLEGGMLPAESRPGGGLLEMVGVGGTYVVQRPVFEAGCRPGAPDVLDRCESVVFCERARAAGFRVWLDRDVTTVACWKPEIYEHCLREGGKWAGGFE